MTYQLGISIVRIIVIILCLLRPPLSFLDKPLPV
jgi:hypothetical protein